MAAFKFGECLCRITLFGDVALTMLKMMGHSTTVPGAILAAHVPAALSRLTAALDAEKALPPVEDKDADKPVVSMALRALPLFDFLLSQQGQDPT